METKFTPAPWTLRETPTSIAVIGANNETLFHDDKRIPGVIEDARLIATAPEMLDMLKKCLDALVYVGPWETPVGLIERVQEVITKAESNDAAL